MAYTRDDHKGYPSIIKTPGVSPLLALIALGMTSFSLLLPLSPAWAISNGASEAAAGSVTSVLMAFTIFAQLLTNEIIRRIGWGKVLALGIIALGAPAALQSVSSGFYAILISSAFRGVGFGLLTVGGATAMALLVSAERRGAAIGAYGLSVAGPQLLFISSAPLLEQYFGRLPVTLFATMPLLGLLFIIPLGRQLLASDSSPPPARPDAWHKRQTLCLTAPTLLVLLTVTSSCGALLSFASQITSSATAATAVLLCLTGAAAPARWLFGVLSDRHDTLSMISGLSAVLVAGLGMLSMALLIGDSQLMLCLGSALMGVAYGGLQSTSLVHAFQAGGTERIPSVSVLWNVTFDLGTGTGALVAGGLATAAGYSFTFTGLTVLAVLGIATALRKLYAPARSSAQTRI